MRVLLLPILTIGIPAFINNSEVTGSRIRVTKKTNLKIAVAFIDDATRKATRDHFTTGSLHADPASLLRFLKSSMNVLEPFKDPKTGLSRLPVRIKIPSGPPIPIWNPTIF
jgi:hypothetical protein